MSERVICLARFCRSVCSMCMHMCSAILAVSCVCASACVFSNLASESRFLLGCACETTAHMHMHTHMQSCTCNDDIQYDLHA